MSNNTTANTPNRSGRGGRLTPHRKTPMRSGASYLAGTHKRKRTALDTDTEDLYTDEFFLTSSAKGDIEIMEMDPDGKYVKIRNKGNVEVSIGGWQLKRESDGKDCTYKFHRSLKIDGGATVTVWSSDVSGIVHEPPSNIVMKSQKWLAAGYDGNIKMVLLNGDGDEVAAMERQKRSVVKNLPQRLLKGGQTTLDGGSITTRHGPYLARQQVVSESSDQQQQGEEKCGIM